MERLIIFNEWMTDKIQGFCSWFEIKTKLGCDFIANFLNITFLSIALIMIFTAKYYNVNYLTIEIWFGNFIFKSLFFIILLLTFLKILLPMSKEKKKEWNEKRAVQSPVYYQIKKILKSVKN